MSKAATITGALLTVFCCWCFTTGPEWFAGGQYLTIIGLVVGIALLAIGIFDEKHPAK